MEYTFLQKFSVLSYFQLSIAILDMYGMLLSTIEQCLSDQIRMFILKHQTLSRSEISENTKKA